MSTNLEDLQARIRQGYGSVHTFCRITGLPRGTVYHVLSGRYAGNMGRQTMRIQAVLDGTAKAEDVSASVNNITEILSNTACNLCLRKGRCTRRRAKRCAAVHAAQARRLLAFIHSGG